MTRMGKTTSQQKIISPAEEAVQKDREEKLAETLKNRLHITVQGNKAEFIQHAEAEAVQKDREEKLAETLKNRLHIYVQGNKAEFIQHAEAEVSKLRNAGFSHY
ncbi:hypothetical protein ZEAMMB73_Zm00001d037634 [Zea mays]|uniref:DNAJ-containing protein X-domain domain-containing protein n=1 Tax=Zea mays TaxID=4577 RepID=A0A1D6LZI6_MAIZE|nr:hypothetical protein ZEAMMB73_Zm00001d037634 [Zea mays]